MNRRQVLLNTHQLVQLVFLDLSSRLLVAELRHALRDVLC